MLSIARVQHRLDRGQLCTIEEICPKAVVERLEFMAKISILHQSRASKVIRPSFSFKRFCAASEIVLMGRYNVSSVYRTERQLKAFVRTMSLYFVAFECI